MIGDTAITPTNIGKEPENKEPDTIVFTVPEGIADENWNLDDLLTVATVDQAMLLVEIYQRVPEEIALEDYDPANIKDSGIYRLGYIVSEDKPEPPHRHWVDVQGVRIVNGVPYLVGFMESTGDEEDRDPYEVTRLTVGMVKALVRAYYQSMSKHINPMY